MLLIEPKNKISPFPPDFLMAYKNGESTKNVADMTSISVSIMAPRKWIMRRYLIWEERIEICGKLMHSRLFVADINRVSKLLNKEQKFNSDKLGYLFQNFPKRSK